MKARFKKNVNLLLVFVMSALAFIPMLLNSQMVYASDHGQELIELSQEDIDKLTPFLEAIEEIPIELLESGSSMEINEYMLNRNVKTRIYNDSIGETEEDIETPVQIVPRKNWWKCSLAIGQVIVAVGIPASKIVQIKKYVAALGGVKMAAKLLVGATTVSEKLYGTVKSLGVILGTLTGVTGVYEHCLK